MVKLARKWSRLSICSSSLETILAMLDEMNPDESDLTLPLIQVVHAGVGIVTSTDLKMAAVDGSTIYCYNVGLAPTLKRNQIEIRNTSI